MLVQCTRQYSPIEALRTCQNLETDAMNPCCCIMAPFLRPEYEFDRCMAVNEAYSVAASSVRAVTTQTLLPFIKVDRGVQEKRQVPEDQVWDLGVVVTSCTRASKQGIASGATPDFILRQAFARFGRIRPYLALPASFNSPSSPQYHG